MKKALFLVCGISLFFIAKAQIQITSSSMPSSGDTVRYSSVNPTGLNLNLGVKGADKIWDYSSLKSTGQDIYEYISANKTPYLFYFFNQIGQKTADSLGVGQFAFKNIYSFYTKNTSVFKAEGLGYSFSGIPLASNYTDEDEIYQFPLVYNDSDVSTFRFKFSIPGQTLFSVIQKGTRINKVDGWGSIKTPYKTYTDVIRVKVIIDEVDSIVSSFGSAPFPRKQVIYRWLSADEKIPVLEIIGTETGNTFTAAQILYRDAYNGLGNPLKPRASFTVSKTSGFTNIDTFSFTDRTTPFAQGFQWQFSPSAGVKYVKNTSATSRNPVVVFTDKGLYSVSLTASNTGGTDDTTAPNLIAIDFPASTLNFDPQFRMGPNPSMGTLTVANGYVGSSYQIYNVSGQLVKSGVFEERTISIETLENGVYFIEMGHKTAKFVLNKD